MNVINQAELKEFLSKYPVSTQVQQIIGRHPLINRFKLKMMNSTKVLDLCHKLNSQKKDKPISAEGGDAINFPAWNRWQLGFFIWIVLFYCQALHKSIQELLDEDYQFFDSIFLNRSLERLKHQVLSLFPHNLISKPTWTAQQDQFLKTIVHRQQQQGAIQWKFVSFQLFKSSSCKFFKSYGQCRERWNNHLDTHITKDQWNIQEELLMLSQIKELGKKWSAISKMFSGRRTQHMIKNRYNSLLKKWKKNNWRLSEDQLVKKMLQNVKRKMNKKHKTEENLTLQKKSDHQVIVEENHEDLKEENIKEQQEQQDYSIQNNLVGLPSLLSPGMISLTAHKQVRGLKHKESLNQISEIIEVQQAEPINQIQGFWHLEQTWKDNLPYFQ